MARMVPARISADTASPGERQLFVRCLVRQTLSPSFLAKEFYALK